MPINNVYNWIFNVLSPKYKGSKDKNIDRLCEFWNEFYSYAHVLVGNQTTEEGAASHKRYKESVIGLLDEFRKEHEMKNGRVVATPEELKNLQLEIENMTMNFDELSIYKSCPNILMLLIDENKECARDYLLSKLDSKADLALIAELGQYTLEALIVHVLCVLFSSAECNVMVRVATLVEQLERNTRSQAKIVGQRRKTAEVSPGQSQDSGRKSRLMYTIGTALVEFMEERGLVNILLHDSSNSKVTMKKDSYYKGKNLFVVCNFDISLLPLKLNMPMVSPPIEWKTAKAKAGSLSDLTGGYLSNHTSAMYDRYRLLSSSNIHNFYLELKEPEKLCQIMSSLQSHPLEINAEFLFYLELNHESFVELGLLSPKFVSNLNVQDCTGKLREIYMQNDYIKEKFTYNELLLTLEKDIQKGRYEKLIFELASAYVGYKFYLPAFLDFRGRIYRCGVLHFHERDLSRCLIQFADAGKPDRNVAEVATCYHFYSFNSYKKAFQWYNKELVPKVQEHGIYPTNNIIKKDQVISKPLAVIADFAKHPFQFLSSFLSVYIDNIPYNGLPITQDASASAYQIMSYLLLNDRMARNTNLIPSPKGGDINDIYTNIKDELYDYIGLKIKDKALSSTLIEVINRKVVKGIFMPIIYGKTIMSTAQDLKGSLSKYLTHKECFMVAKLCFEFWKEKFQNMDCLIRLVRSIGWIASSSGRSVQYEVENFTTVQDYVKMDAINIWVYNRLHKKRRKVTLRVASDKRDSKKTEVSTFVNFIHQKDAHIAMKVVEMMLHHKAPIYTVHDNFITTSSHSEKLGEVYCKAMQSLGSPLQIINQFIYLNLVKHLDNQEDFIINEVITSANEVITSANLKRILEKNVPEKIVKCRMKVWDERINTIVSSYYHYTTLVCGENYMTPEEGGWLHREKYERFCKKMEKNPGFPLYSVHY